MLASDRAKQYGSNGKYMIDGQEVDESALILVAATRLQGIVNLYYGGIESKECKTDSAMLKELELVRYLVHQAKLQIEKDMTKYAPTPAPISITWKNMKAEDNSNV